MSKVITLGSLIRIIYLRHQNQKLIQIHHHEENVMNKIDLILERESNSSDLFIIINTYSVIIHKIHNRITHITKFDLISSSYFRKNP